MVDIRTWKKWNQDQAFHPEGRSKNGLMIEQRHLRPVIDKIIELLDNAEKNERIDKSTSLTILDNAERQESIDKSTSLTV